MDALTIVIGVIAALVIIFLIKGLVIVQQSEAMVIERLGEYSRTLEQGLHLLIPFFDRPRIFETRKRIADGEGRTIKIPHYSTRIDRRETVLDLEQVQVITKDNVTIGIDTAVFFQIITPKDAVLEVANLIQAVETLAQTSLRSKCGEMELDKLLESRTEINSALTITLDEAGNKWGCKVNRVEVQGIQVPEEVEESMRKQLAAERQRRATVTEALGDKEAQINVAEGDKMAAILRAEGQKKAIQTLMEATQNAQLSEKDIIQYLIALEYMKTLPKIAQEGERVFLPYEATALLGSIGGLQDLLPKATRPSV